MADNQPSKTDSIARIEDFSILRAEIEANVSLAYSALTKVPNNPPAKNAWGKSHTVSVLHIGPETYQAMVTIGAKNKPFVTGEKAKSWRDALASLVKATGGLVSTLLDQGKIPQMKAENFRPIKNGGDFDPTVVLG